MQVFLETERLVFREILPTDIDGMFELDSNPLVHRYLGNKPVKRREESEEMIQSIRKQYIELGIGRWAVIEKESQFFIGWAGLKLNTEPANDHVDYYDLGYRFIPEFWGKGFATEASAAIKKYGFEIMNLPVIYGLAEINNLASRKVLEKTGMQFVEFFDLDGIQVAWYELANPGI